MHHAVLLTSADPPLLDQDASEKIPHIAASGIQRLLAKAEI